MNIIVTYDIVNVLVILGQESHIHKSSSCSDLHLRGMKKKKILLVSPKVRSFFIEEKYDNSTKEKLSGKCFESCKLHYKHYPYPGPAGEKLFFLAQSFYSRIYVWLNHAARRTITLGR